MIAPQDRIWSQAAADARVIINWWYAGLPVGRRHALEAGISHRRHGWAIGFLRLAGVCALDGLRITATSQGLALRKVQKLLDAGPGGQNYERLQNLNSFPGY